MKRFKPEQDSHYEQKKAVEFVGCSQSELLQRGQMGNFMNRFFISWRWDDKFANSNCISCHVGHNIVAAEVRPMKECDWLYLSQLSNSQSLDSCLVESCSEHARLSAGQSLRLLKRIPAAARKSLPVLVDSNGLLLSIPVHSSFLPYLLIVHFRTFSSY